VSGRTSTGKNEYKTTEGRVSWESTDTTSSTRGDRGEEDSKVHVLGNLTVVPHEANVDVIVVDKGGLVADETNNDLTTVVEDVCNSSSVNGEAHVVGEGVKRGRGEPESRPYN